MNFLKQMGFANFITRRLEGDVYNKSFLTWWWDTFPNGSFRLGVAINVLNFSIRLLEIKYQNVQN